MVNIGQVTHRRMMRDRTGKPSPSPWGALCLLAPLFVSACVNLASAQQIPADLTPQQQEKLDKSILDYIKVMRVKETKPQPPQVEEFNKKYTEYCRRRAEAEHKKHGRWFYCEDHKEFRGNIRWDEVVTYRVYWQLYARYGSLEKIPNYSKENHEKAVKFWQGWQRKNGSFYNFFTGKGGGSDNHCNGKYIPPPNIMGLLGCRPLYETSGYGAAKLDTDTCLRQIASRKMNHGTATASVILKRIHEGKTEFIPILERAVELSLSQLSPHTGMFHGPKGNPSGAAWSGYGTTAETMKGLLRIIGYMGAENMPYRHVRADTLIENQEQFRKGAVSVKRNTAEMIVQCLLESPYRSEELLKALDGHSKVIMSGQPWKNHMTGDYTAYILMMFGPYLNWEGYEGRAPRTPFPVGAEYDYRVEVGPFGRCVNVIKKRPEELLWHKDWSCARYGLRARNTAHEKRKVIDVLPASADGWTKSTDKEGRIVLTRTFALEKTRLDSPYLKIKWSGPDIEIVINDIPVRRKLGGLADYGAVHITPEARKSLHPGENTMMIRAVSGAKGTLKASAGLIDWRLPPAARD